MMNAMKEALRRRKGKGVDISIVLGDPEEVKSSVHGDQKPDEEKEQDLAPELVAESMDVKEGAMPVVANEEMAHDDEAQDMALLAKILGKGSLLSRHMKKG